MPNLKDQVIILNNRFHSPVYTCFLDASKDLTGLITGHYFPN